MIASSRIKKVLQQNWCHNISPLCLVSVAQSYVYWNNIMPHSCIKLWGSDWRSHIQYSLLSFLAHKEVASTKFLTHTLLPQSILNFFSVTLYLWCQTILWLFVAIGLFAMEKFPSLFVLALLDWSLLLATSICANESNEYWMWIFQSLPYNLMQCYAALKKVIKIHEI